MEQHWQDSDDINKRIKTHFSQKSHCKNVAKVLLCDIMYCLALPTSPDNGHPSLGSGSGQPPEPL